MGCSEEDRHQFKPKGPTVALSLPANLKMALLRVKASMAWTDMEEKTLSYGLKRMTSVMVLPVALMTVEKARKGRNKAGLCRRRAAT